MVPFAEISQDPSHNVAACLKCSNTEACTKKLPQILTKKVDNESREIDPKNLCEVFWFPNVTLGWCILRNLKRVFQLSTS